LISKISSTCFGQSFAHVQERKTEIFTACGIVSCCCVRQGSRDRLCATMCMVWRKLLNVKQLPSYHTCSAMLPLSEPLPITTTRHYTICCKNLSLMLPKMGKSLPETCWA